MRSGLAAVVSAALVLSVGIAACGYFVSRTLYNSQVAINTAQAKGLSERIVPADTATWTIGYSVTGKTKDEVPALYKNAESLRNRIHGMLSDAGFEGNEINAEILGYSKQVFRDDNQVVVDESHRIGSAIVVSTSKVEKVAPTRAEVNKLLAEGFDITNYSPSYTFTKINEIKPGMLKEAAQNARIAASEFAQNAGAKVGKIRSASQGGFIVEDASAGESGNSSLMKEVRVVTTIDFYLTD
jgi:hypothetical protein